MAVHGGGDLDLLVAARLSPGYTGGLAEYQRRLVRGLLEETPSLRAAFAAPEAAGDADLPAPLLRPVRGGDIPRLWMSLASRPVLHPLLLAWIRRCHLGQLSGLPAGPALRVVHFVGTGWDFFGFAMWHLARRRGARFTVWPALHAGAWGDDAIDLRLYRSADAVFCQSRHEQAHLIRLGLEAARTRLCGLPPMCLGDGDGERFRRATGTEGAPLVLFLGRRDAGKGYPALLQAWPLVRERFPRAVLLVAGPGERVAGLDGVLDLGLVDERTKADALAACGVFCLPSAQESFGIVYAEAWSYGKPVVCGTAPASREWIGHEEQGLWCDGTPGGIASALGRLLADDGLRQRLGAAGQRRQREQLTWERTLAVHREAFGW